MKEFTLLLISCIIMCVGLLGTIVPLIPGALIVWLGTFCYAMGTNFAKLSIIQLTFLFTLMVASWSIDYILTLYGTKKFGKSSAWGVFGASLGIIVGFIASLFGQFYLLILSPALGAMTFEFMSGRELSDACRSGIGTFLGFALGRLSSFLISLLIIILFFIFIA